MNTANGLGAWLGAVVIAEGYGYRAPSLLGAGLALLGLLVFGVGMVVERRRVAAVTRLATSYEVADALTDDELDGITAQRGEAVPAYSSTSRS